MNPDETARPLATENALEKTDAATVSAEPSTVNSPASPVSGNGSFPTQTVAESTTEKATLYKQEIEDALALLAKLPAPHYEACRKVEAKRLTFRPTVLDKQVAERRRLYAQNHATKPPEIRRPLRTKPPAAPTSFEQWHATIAANFPTLARPAEICASVFTQLLVNDVSNPFALALVDVPSSGKTITLNFFDIAGLAYLTDSFTPASFVSHASNVSRDDLEKVDLLPRIRFRTMIVRDLAPIFGAKEDDLLKTLGILTRALDGEGLQIDSGTHGARGYAGDYLFMLLAGTTPIPPRVFKIMGTLGSRLFFLALHSPTKSHDDLIAQNRVGSRRDKERVCREATSNFLRTAWCRFPDGVNWKKEGDPEFCLRVVARCAELLATLRGVIQVSQSGPDATLNHSVPVIEQPDRINCLLYNLARGHAIVCGRDQLSDADLAPVLEVTFDSAPMIRSKLFRALVANGGTLRTSDVERVLRASTPTALKEMETLAVLEVVRTIKAASESPPPPPPKPDDKTEDQWTEMARQAAAKEGRFEHAIRLHERFGWFASGECKALRWEGNAS